MHRSAVRRRCALTLARSNSAPGLRNGAATEHHAPIEGDAIILAADTMGRPPTQIESFESPDIDHEKDSAENGVNPRAAKVMYIVIAVVLVALFLLVGVGLHIPTGG